MHIVCEYRNLKKLLYQGYSSDVLIPLIKNVLHVFIISKTDLIFQTIKGLKIKNAGSIIIKYQSWGNKLYYNYN